MWSLVRTVLVAVFTASVVVADPLVVRQTTNTNARISQAVDTLSIKVHVNIPNINTLEAQHRATDATIRPQVQQLIAAFNTTTNTLKGIPVSAGSTTVTPTNDDIGITFSSVLSLVASGLSGLDTAMVPSLPTLMASLDPVIASTVTTLNTTLPGSVNLVHIMMLDARQFLVDDGLNQTNAAIGF